MKAKVFALEGGTLEQVVRGWGLSFEGLSLFGLLPFCGVVFTVRSRDTMLSLLARLIGGNKRVVRLDFVNKRLFWDRFLDEVVPLERLGWIEHREVRVSKGDFKVAVVSRLKADRDVGKALDILKGLPFRCRSFWIGGGDERLLGGFPVVHVKRKLRDFRRLLAHMDVLLYVKAGTDKSCRAVLEAMDSRVAVVASEPLARRYLDSHGGVYTTEPVRVLTRLWAHPRVLKRMQCDAGRKALGYQFSVRCRGIVR